MLFLVKIPIGVLLLATQLDNLFRKKSGYLP
jgi:hypothetical protein